MGLLEPGFELQIFTWNYTVNRSQAFMMMKLRNVRRQDEGFQGPERLTYGHEYVHALQDQNYDIENGLI
jgi:hypothetical protein